MLFKGIITLIENETSARIDGYSKNKSRSHILQIDEQSNWLGNEVDIIIKEKASTPESYKSSATGLLSDFKDKDLMDSEKSSYAFSQFQTGRVKVN